MELSVSRIRSIARGVGIEINSLVYEMLIFVPILLSELKSGNLKRGHGQTILIFPGFISGDWAVFFLKTMLNLLGYKAYAWGQGVNHGKFKDLEGGLTEMVDYLYHLHGQPMIFVGWSKGARIALKMASKMKSQKVAGIITIGGPIVPDGRYSLDDIPAWLSFFTSFNEWVHNIVLELQTAAPLPPPDIPTTVITFGLDQLVSRKASEVPKEYVNENLKNFSIDDCGHVAAGAISIRTVVQITKHIMKDFRQYDRTHGTHLAI